MERVPTFVGLYNHIVVDIISSFKKSRKYRYIIPWSIHFNTYKVDNIVWKFATLNDIQLMTTTFLYLFIYMVLKSYDVQIITTKSEVRSIHGSLRTNHRFCLILPTLLVAEELLALIKLSLTMVLWGRYRLWCQALIQYVNKALWHKPSMQHYRL